MYVNNEHDLNVCKREIQIAVSIYLEFLIELNLLLIFFIQRFKLFINIYKLRRYCFTCNIKVTLIGLVSFLSIDLFLFNFNLIIAIVISFRPLKI